MTDEVWAEIARAALAAQTVREEPRVVEPVACRVPGCTNGEISRTESGIVKLHYPTPTAARPCVASWKVLCPKCGLPMLDGAHLLTKLKTC